MVPKKTTKQSHPSDVTNRTRGIVVHFGQALGDRQRRAAIRSLVAETSNLAQVVDEKSVKAARPLGAGAPDVLIPFIEGTNVSIQTAWEIVRKVRKNVRIEDAEPAVRTASGQVADQQIRDLRSGGPDRPPLPDSDALDWSLRLINAPSWSGKGPTGDGIKIGHPDTGYTAHPQLPGGRLLVAEGYDFEDHSTDPADRMTGPYPGHGTSTASVIMGGVLPAPHIFGVANRSSLLPIRVSDSVIHFDFTNLSQALYWARDAKCDLISMSLGGPWAGRALGRAIDAVVNAGIVPLAAAGNVWPFVVYPARFDNVVAVAACNAEHIPWDDSAHGETVDITAPGESVWRALSQIDNTNWSYTIARSSGTSYAVATTAGACALWMQLHGAAVLRKKYSGSVVNVFLQLLKSAGHVTPPNWDTANFGVGILDVEKLLNAPLPAAAQVIPKAAPRTLARVERPYAWARLQHYFPTVDPESLARALFPAFRGPSRAAALHIADELDELEFYVATNHTVHSAISRAARRKSKGTPARKPAVSTDGVSIRQALAHVASAPLASILRR